MNSNQESNKRMLGTMSVTLTVLVVALLMDIETARGWALVGIVTITAVSVVLHLTKPVAQTTSQAIDEARRR